MTTAPAHGSSNPDLVSTAPAVSAAHPNSVSLTGALACVAGGAALLISFLVVPGPDVADVHDPGWVPGHLLSAVAFGLLTLGLPAIAGSLGSRLGFFGVLGYVAVMARFVLSTGSHLYSLCILPKLAPVTSLHHQVQPEQRLANIYAGHGDWFNLVIGVGMLGLIYALARIGRGMRTIAALTGLAAVSEFLGFPFGLGLLAIVSIWIGARLLRHGDAAVPLRAASPIHQP